MSGIKESLRNLQVAFVGDPSLTASVEPFSHRFPWQLYTGWHKLQLTAKLPQTFPVDELREELDRVLDRYAPAQQHGQYHLGGWTGVALNAIEADPYGVKDLYGIECHKTPALELAPRMEEIIDFFPCEKRTVRILALEPGKKIFWHRDLLHSVDSHILRLHVPIITNDKVGFQISHEDCSWQPGELWYGDFTFPHRLQNAGEMTRVHLVLDLQVNDELLAMMPDSLQEQKATRMRARERCSFMLKAWHRLFATQKRLHTAQKERQPE